MDNNARLKLIAGALRLNRSDIARAVSAGGIETSNSKADSWLRATGAIKTGSGGSEPGTTLRRDKKMRESEFDAFCIGLKAIMEELDDER